MKIPQALLPVLAWLFSAAFALYILSPGLHGDFFFDDEPNIVENKAIQIDEISLASLAGSTKGTSAGPLGRPVSVISFAINYYLFGLDPYTFKATNLALHIFNGLLAALLISQLIKLLEPEFSDRKRLWIAVWVSAMWMAHPINVLPVMLAVQRMTLFSSLFLLLAMIFHSKAITVSSSSKWYFYAAAWAVCWPLAIFSKETGLLFPAFVLLLSYFQPGESNSRIRMIAGAGVLISAVLVVMVLILGGDWLSNAYTMRSFSLFERLLTEARVLWFYVAQIVLPNFNHFAVYLDDFVISKSLVNPATTLFSVLAWIAVGISILLMRFKAPLAGFSAGWFIVGHSLESSILPLEIAHEYRNYLPSLGLVLGLGYLGIWSLGKLKLDHIKTTAVVLAIFPLMILGLFSGLRAKQLGNPLIGPQMEATRHPSSARANFSAGLSLFRSGYGDRNDPIGGQQIRYYFEQSGEVDPTFKQGYIGLITWSCASGRKVNKDWTDELKSRLNSTPLSPSERDLPNEILRVFLHMPNCLNKENVHELFVSGAENKTADVALKAKFLEAAADYELLVSLNPIKARSFLAEAVSVWPQNNALKNKLKGFNQQQIK